MDTALYLWLCPLINPTQLTQLMNIVELNKNQSITISQFQHVMILFQKKQPSLGGDLFRKMQIWFENQVQSLPRPILRQFKV